MDENEEMVEEEEEEEEVRPAWGGVERPAGGSLFVDTGRGHTAEVQVGAPFKETIESVADEAHYGGYFRVFLNGNEVINPEDAPESIEAGQRIVITAYDKVG